MQWLYDHSGDGYEMPGIDTYLAYHGLSPDNGRMIVDHLAKRGLVQDLSTYGGPDARILPGGIAWVQRVRASRDDTNDEHQENTVARGFSINQ